MWRRWGNDNQQMSIGNPTDFQYLDQEEQYLETIPEVDSVVSSRRQSTNVELPALPFRAVPPMEDHYDPSGRGSWSRTTGTYQYHNRGSKSNADDRRGSATSEISPLTPRASHDFPARDDQPVSPLEPSPKVYRARSPLPERDFQSQIPRPLRIAVPQESKAGTTQPRSADIIQDLDGKTAAKRSDAPLVEMQFPHLKDRTKQILAGLKERDSAKKKPWGQVPPPVAVKSTDPLDNPQKKEPWRGASGRSAIVEPVQNNPNARTGPITRTERSSSRPQPYGEGEEFMPSAHMATTTPKDDTRSYARKLSPLQIPETSSNTLENDAYKPSIPAVNPLRGVAELKPLQSPFRSPLESSATPIPEIINQSQQRTESPAFEAEPTTPDSPPSVAEPHIIDRSEDHTESLGVPGLEHEQSRFSWTTYTETVPDSPNSAMHVGRSVSPPPPMPDLSSTLGLPKSSEGFLNSPTSPRASMISRKPVPKQERAVSLMSTKKDLPPVPDELDAADRLISMEAQLEALARRKKNIQRIIHDLEASLKKNAVSYDLYKRREVNKTIADQKLELDNIAQDMHEIGIQAHRAQKKRDRDDNYEQPTGLWIRRITN